jgi:hypothetical protein
MRAAAAAKAMAIVGTMQRRAARLSEPPRLSKLWLTLIQIYHKFDSMQVKVAKWIKSPISCIEERAALAHSIPVDFTGRAGA